MAPTLWLAALSLSATIYGAAAQTAHHWAYWGVDGPSTWPTYYPDCGLSAQSPVNLPYASTLPAAPAPLKIYGSCIDTLLEAAGPEFKWEYEAPNTCTATGTLGASVVYDLLQVHVHAPSEHKINGVLYDAEIHFVHKNAASGKLLVIGVPLKANSIFDNKWLASALTPLIFINPPTETLYKTVLKERTTIIPMTGKWLNYQGSLTTPPCSQIVEWWVAATPVSISYGQLSFLQLKQLAFPDNNFGKNNRPVQALNGRTVKRM